MKITLTATPDVEPQLLEDVLGLLTAAPSGPIQFDFVQDLPVEFNQDGFEFDAFFDACRAWRRQTHRPDHEYVFVLTGLRNAPNWFSHIDKEAGGRSAFLFTGDWEFYTPRAHPKYPLAAEVVVNQLVMMLHEKVGEQTLGGMLHMAPVGCVLDFCEWKPEITFKLRTGDICEECMQNALAVMSKDELVQLVGILEESRKGMVRHRFLGAMNNRQADPIEELPLHVAITWRRAFTFLSRDASIENAIRHVESLYQAVLAMLAAVALHDDHQKAAWLQTNIAIDGDDRLGHLSGIVQALEGLLEDEAAQDALAEHFTQHQVNSLASAVERYHAEERGLAVLLEALLMFADGGELAGEAHPDPLRMEVLKEARSVHASLLPVFRAYRPVVVASNQGAAAMDEGVVLVEHLSGSTQILKQELMALSDDWDGAMPVRNAVYYLNATGNGAVFWHHAPHSVYFRGAHPLQERCYYPLWVPFNAH